MAVGLQVVLEAAKRAARRRNQGLSTGHLILAMLRHDSQTAVLLAQQGVREVELLRSLSMVEQESANAVDLAWERAQKIAELLDKPVATPMHLLFAIAREPRSTGYRCLEWMGVGAGAVYAEVLAVLDPDQADKGSEARGARGTRPTSFGLQPGLQAAEGRPIRPNRRLASAEAASKPVTRLPPVQPLQPAQDPRSMGQASVHGKRVGGDQPLAHGKRASDDPPSVHGKRASDDPPFVHGKSGCGDQPSATPFCAEQPSSRPSPAGPISAKNEPAAKGAGKGAGKGVENTECKTRGARAGVRDHALRSRYALDPKRFPTLCALGRNLMVAAEAGEIDPVFARDREVEQLLDVLARRRANSPLLVGPPGVGKTAVVEALALRLVKAGDRPGGLSDSVIIELSVGSLMSGTGLRGALAEKLRALRAEVSEAKGLVLLFIDETHALVAPQEGPDGLANELKSALARGELACIGATTDVEFRRIFERDPALARRFTRIDIQEPSSADALRILQGISPHYEKHHGVAYEPAALQAAVEMSVRYLAERHLPDKAIAVIDQAAARTQRRGGGIVDVEAIAQVIAERAHVPVERLMLRDADRLLELEQHLQKRVIGQPEAIAQVAPALRRSAAGFRGTRPLGTFLFLGPTGVGKTEMAKAIGDLLFPGSEMTRLDMSEYSESHAVARMLGAPPGYVGHEDGGQLTEAVRARPYQLILLDEVEKAHQEVLLALLPLLDEGRLTDARGRTVDYTNTVIVMTSNLGANRLETKAPIGFGEEPALRTGAGAGNQGHPGLAAARAALRDGALAAARAALPPELWNRIEEPVYFYPLTEEDVRAIADRFVENAAEIAHQRHHIRLQVDPTALDALVAAGGYDPFLGARPMKRTVARLVEAPLAAAILSGELSRGDCVLLRGEGARFCMERQDPIAEHPAEEPDVDACLV